MVKYENFLESHNFPLIIAVLLPGICSSCLLIIGAILCDVEPNAPFRVLSTLQKNDNSDSLKESKVET